MRSALVTSFDPATDPQAPSDSAIRAILDAVHRGSRHPCGDQEAPALTPGLDPSSGHFFTCHSVGHPGNFSWTLSVGMF